MKRRWIFGLMVPFAAFATDFSEAEKLIKPYDDATRSYLYARAANDSNAAAEKNKCIELSGGAVTQILRINQDGVIDLVVSNAQSEKSTCLEKVYLGSSFKATPSAPIYIKQKSGS